jgi:hypothetical protein
MTLTHIDLDQIRRNAGKLHSRVRARNMRETVAGLIAIVLLTWFSIGESRVLDRLSFILMMGGMLYVIWYLWRHGQANVLPQDYGLTDAATFHRRELEHQRDLLRSAFRWYLGPFLPGWILSVISATQKSAPKAILLALTFGAATWAVWWINRRAAAGLDRCIAALVQDRES